MARKLQWTEATIARKEGEGDGKGDGAGYKPWLDVMEVSSLGRSRQVSSAKFGRTLHLLSDIEYDLFLALEWQTDIVQLYEQFPLERKYTQKAANELGVRHPYYPGTHVPTVMTIDFLAIKKVQEELEFIAFDAKPQSAAEDTVALAKLEISREVLSHMQIKHHVVFDCDMPKKEIKNINWIRGAPLSTSELQDYEGIWDDVKPMVLQGIGDASKRGLTLNTFCSQLDIALGHKGGTGLRAARMLMTEKKLIADLSIEKLQLAPLGKFKIKEDASLLQVAGGTR